jgi:hypothetical protein
MTTPTRENAWNLLVQPAADHDVVANVDRAAALGRPSGSTRLVRKWRLDSSRRGSIQPCRGGKSRPFR